MALIVAKVRADERERLRGLVESMPHPSMSIPLGAGTPFLMMADVLALLDPEETK